MIFTENMYKTKKCAIISIWECTKVLYGIYCIVLFGLNDCKWFFVKKVPSLNGRKTYVEII